MAQLNDTMVQGDLRVTGTMFGDLNGNADTATTAKAYDTSFSGTNSIATALAGKQDIGNYINRDADAYRRRDNQTGNGWGKIATISINTHDNYLTASWIVTYRGEVISTAVLELNIRFNSSGQLPVCLRKALYATDDFSKNAQLAVKITGVAGSSTTIELWAFLAKTWHSISIQELNEGYYFPDPSITWTYSNVNGGGTDKPEPDAENNIQVVDVTHLCVSDDSKVVTIADAYAKASNVSNMWCKVAEFTWTGTKSTFASSWMVTFIASSGAMTSESFFLNFAIRANDSGAPTLRTFVTSIINTPSATNSRRFKMVISGSSGNMTMKLYYFNGTSNYSSMTIREITATQQSSAGKSKNTWAYTSYASGEGETTEPTGDYNYECEFVYASSLAVESADALNVDTLGQAGGVTDFDLLVPAVNKVKYYTINGDYTNGSKGTASTGYWGELQVFWRNSVPYQVYLEWNANGIIYFCRYSSTYDSTAAKWIWNAWVPFRAGFDKDGNNISSTYLKVKDGVSFSNVVRSRQTESGSGWGKVAEWTGALTNTQVTASWNAFTTYKVDNIGRAINAQISLNVGGSATATDVPVVGTFKVVATEKSATTYDFCLVVTGTNASCTIQLYILSQYNTSTSLSMIDRGGLGLLKDKGGWTYSDSSGGQGGKPAADASTNKFVYSPQYVYTGTTQEGLGTCAYYSLYTANTSSSAPGWVKMATVTKSSATYQGFRLSGYFYKNNGNLYATKGASGIHFQAVFTATNNTASLLYGPSDLDVADCVRIVKTASSPLTWELQFNFGTNNNAYAVYASYEGDLTKLDNEIKIERDTVAGTTGDGVLATITPEPDTTWHTSYALWQNLLEVGDADSAVPASPRKDKGGSVGEYYVPSSASNVPSSQYGYHIRTSVYRYSSTVFRGTQLATASLSTPVSVVYERSGTSSDGTTWTWGTWNRVTMSSDLATATVGTAKNILLEEIGTSAVDLNSLTASDMTVHYYTWSNTNRGNVSNKPSDAVYTIKVFPCGAGSAGTYVMQEAYKRGTNERYVRRRSDGSTAWSSWQLCAYGDGSYPNMSVGTCTGNASTATHLSAHGYVRLWASGQYNSSKPYALLAEKAVGTTGNWGYGQLFKMEVQNRYVIFKIDLRGSSSSIASGTNTARIIYGHGFSQTEVNKAVVVTYAYTANATCIVRIYSNLSLTATDYQRVSLRQLDNHAGDQWAYNDWDAFTYYQKGDNTAMVASVTGTVMTNVFNTGTFCGNATSATTAKAYDTSFSGTNSIATALAAKQPGRVIVAPTYSGGVWSNDFATILEAIEDGKDVFLYTGNSEGNVDTYHMVPLTEVVKSSNNYMAFQFSRPRVWSSISENGILDTWTCTATSPYWQFEGKNVYYAATAGEAFSAANASNYSSGGTIESTFSAINTALAGRALGKTITLASNNSLSVTIPWATRTGRSSMLAIVSGNNGVQSCVQVSWFKDANNAITNAKMNVLSYTNTGAGCVPMFYVQYGTQAHGACGIYLVLDNSSWATQVTVIPNMENVDSVAFGYVAKSTAQTATDLSSARVWNLQGAWDGTPTLGSTNAVTSGGIASALADKQATITFYGTNTGGTLNNPAISKSIFDLIKESHVIAYARDFADTYDSLTGGLISTVEIDSYRSLDELFLVATNRDMASSNANDRGVSRKIVVTGPLYTGGDVVAKRTEYTLKPNRPYNGPNGNTVPITEVGWRQHVVFELTMHNTSIQSAETIFLESGGAYQSGTGGYPGQYTQSIITIDGVLYGTPPNPTSWSDSYRYQVAIGSIPSNGARTWQIEWWKVRYPGSSSTYYETEYVIVTTIK